MPSKKTELNPKTTSYEFLGPPGALFVTIGVPLTTYALYFGCSEATGGCPPPLSLATIQDTLKTPSFWTSLWDTQAALFYLAWYTFCVLAWVVLPGDWVEGTKLRTGQTLKYKINGTTIPFLFHKGMLLIARPAFSTLLLTFGITTGIIWTYGIQPLTFIYDNWVGLITASILMSIVQGVACYAASFRKGALLALGGNSGNAIYDVSDQRIQLPIDVVS